MRVLVTGGAGFVGRNLTKRLVDEGHEVTIIASGVEPIPEGVRKVLYTSLNGINWGTVKNQDVVFHQMANNDTLCMDVYEMERMNLHDSSHLFHVAADGGCRKFIYASSTAVYGASPAPYDENSTPTVPLNPYGQSKLKFEAFAKDFGTQEGIVAIGLRYCNVYGPGEEQKGRRMSMIGQILRTMMRGQRPVLFEFGEQKRDWVYVSDVVDINMAAMQSDQNGIYNVGSGCAWSFNEIVAAINEVTGQNITPIYKPCPFADRYQNHTECKIEKARGYLAWSPKYDLRSGIKAYWEYLTASSSAIH